MYRAVSFVLVFLLLACTITAISAAMYEEPAPSPIPPASESVAEPTQVPATEPTQPLPTLAEVEEHLQEHDDYTPRLSAPAKNDPC